MAFDVLDTRQYRADQACGDGVRTDCEDARAPGRTMLGDEQEAWLGQRLAASGACRNAMAQQVPIFGRASTARGEGQCSTDERTGRPAARERLVSSIAEGGVAGPVFLSGDVHGHCGADVRRRPGEPGGQSVAVEFTDTSASLGGDGSVERDYWEAIRPDDPRIAHHADLRGHVAREVTPDLRRTDFMVLDRVEVPDGTLATGGSLVCEHGGPSVQAA